MTGALKIREIQARSVLTESRLPESRYCINPYIGCSHGCVYCYSRFMRRFTGHANEKWGTFVDVKINASGVLKKQLLSTCNREGALLGSVTDGYQPLERKYKITRSILQVLLEHQFPISILTKSDLVLRDLDLLKKFDCCDVGITITSLDDEVRRHFEPYSSSVQQRLNALRKLHDSGVSTYVFVGPILPHFTKIEPILLEVREHTDSVWAEALNIRCGNWSDIEDVLKKYYPRLLPTYKETVLNQDYWDQIGREVKRLTKKLRIPLAGYYRH